MGRERQRRVRLLVSVKFFFSECPDSQWALIVPRAAQLTTAAGRVLVRCVARGPAVVYSSLSSACAQREAARQAWAEKLAEAEAYDDMDGSGSTGGGGGGTRAAWGMGWDTAAEDAFSAADWFADLAAERRRRRFGPCGANAPLSSASAPAESWGRRPKLTRLCRAFFSRV